MSSKYLQKLQVDDFCHLLVPARLPWSASGIFAPTAFGRRFDWELGAHNRPCGLIVNVAALLHCQKRGAALAAPWFHIRRNVPVGRNVFGPTFKIRTFEVLWDGDRSHRVNMRPNQR